MTDPIADMIIRIKNALMAGHDSVSIPHSKIKMTIAEILKAEGYVADVALEPSKPQATITISLKYMGKTPAITDVRRLSKPGRRLYSPVSKIPTALGGYGITILSTSKGIMTGTTARKQNIGGELLCQIW
jgi:small subunit ribosomal protein S8